MHPSTSLVSESNVSMIASLKTEDGLFVGNVWLSSCDAKNYEKSKNALIIMLGG